MNAKKLIYITLGTVSIILALLGTVLPGLPVTPFILLAGWLFSRSSQRIYDKLMSYEIVAKRIRDYKNKGGLTTRKKLYIIVFMSIMVFISSIVILDEGTLRYVVIGAGFVGLIIVSFVVPTAR